MKKSHLIIKGARVNNLKNVDVKIPRDKIVVVTGLSGSGKSSLAFDTIFAEGHRRYVENLSAYARQFLASVKKPEIEKIENLSPVIAIDQTNVNRSPRSTVGTMTELYDWLRILFARLGKPHCPKCGRELTQRTASEIADEILAEKEEIKSQIAILAGAKDKSKPLKEKLSSFEQMGYARVRLGEKTIPVSQARFEIGKMPENSQIEAVIDRVMIDGKFHDRERLVDSIETAMKASGGEVAIAIPGKEDRKYNRYLICSDCGISISEITPRNFSFNNPEGACLACAGLGTKLEVDVSQVIPNRNLSVREGAIKPWNLASARNGNATKIEQMLEKISKESGFSLDVPVKKLDPEFLDMLIYGTRDFEGAVTMLERKYKEANSDFSRGEAEKYMIMKTCPICKGRRLKKESLAVKIAGSSIADFSETPLDMLKEKMSAIRGIPQLPAFGKKLLAEILGEVEKTIGNLCEAGLGYLTLSRSANSLSGGESQRVRLAVQIGSGLTGILYVLDEPSIGLHERDTEKLVGVFEKLRDEGNSVVVVEHDAQIMKKADWIIDMGPGAGENGGEIIFSGTPQKMRAAKTETAQFLGGKKKIFEKKKPARNASRSDAGGYRKGNGRKITVVGAGEHNLKNIDVDFPLGKMIVLTGVSGSGKSSLVSDILGKALSRHFYKAKDPAGKHKAVKGLGNISKVIEIDQSPIGRTPRSNAATYTGVFSHIRDIFASLPEAKKLHLNATHFSFNMKGGRCEVCQGEGQKKIEMHLLPDIYVPCEACGGTRFSQKVLSVEYQGANVADVLDMSADYAWRFFQNHPLVAEKLETLNRVGLGYLKLGQSAMHLSGGEAQRIKLATELSRRTNGKAFYILDEPTIGLHFGDVARLLKILDELVEKGNTVLIVEHNLDVIRSADWVIELGPEGGAYGGEIVFEGTPKEMVKAKTWTAKYLKNKN
ncbi:MAG: excinuclease ABC subunit UvrA [Candidatus Moranbacteria bacterium]|nr:excinuclease ABC subunit UvrA [Candidatus Moranbacteria bacterium]